MKIATLAITLLLSLPGCLAVDMGEDEAFLETQGHAEVSLEWLIVEDDVLISCVDAGAAEIEIAVLGQTEVRERTSCFGGFAVVDAEASGLAIVEVSLIAPSGEPLVTVDLGEIDLVEGATLPLGAVELAL